MSKFSKSDSASIFLLCNHESLQLKKTAIFFLFARNCFCQPKVSLIPEPIEILLKYFPNFVFFREYFEERCRFPIPFDAVNCWKRISNFLSLLSNQIGLKSKCALFRGIQSKFNGKACLPFTNQKVLYMHQIKGEWFFVSGHRYLI